ncbi:hypothetical protein J4Q44_G00255050 [Coregonus suidteri]|uniref:Caspase recruitment domain-containing protein n=1 Tax=Coregonus suidteri TaxID=861788 RepID=A0AAN8L9R9_9TELE
MMVYVKRVKATDLMPNLPCLTPSDREEIQAKKDSISNGVAMQLLLDYVQKRMNWPEELISALEALEHQDLADELRAEWNKHNQNNPSPAATTVVRAHVHPAPPTSPSLPISESSDDPTSSLVLPARPAPVSPGPEPPQAVPTSSPHKSVAEAPIAGTSPGSTSQAPQCLSPSPPGSTFPCLSPPRQHLPLSQPPGSTFPCLSPQAALPLAQPPRQHLPLSQPPRQHLPLSQPPQAAPSPVSAPQAAPSPVSAPQAAPSPVSAPQAAPSPVSAEEEPTVVSEPEPPVSHSDNAASSQPGPVETGSLEDNPSHIVQSETALTLPVSDLNPALSQTEYTPTAAAPALVQAPERRPVQDTTPPTAKVTTFHQKPVEDSDPTATQVTEDDQSRPSTAPAPVDTTPGQVCPSMGEENWELSKPEVLLSENQPYSGGSWRLQMDSGSVSGPEPELAAVTASTTPVTSPDVVPEPAPEPLSSVPGARPLPCQENGVPEELEEPLSHNEPEENTYHSPCLSSLGDQEVLVNVVHVSEDASIQNNDSQTPRACWNHNSQSQITPLSGSTDLDLSSGPNQDGQTEDSLGKAVSKSEESQGLIMIVNDQDTSPSTKQLDPPPPPAISPSVTIVNGSSTDNCHLPEAVEAEVMLKAMMASAVPELKQKQEGEGATSSCGLLPWASQPCSWPGG